MSTWIDGEMAREEVPEVTLKEEDGKLERRSSNGLFKRRSQAEGGSLAGVVARRWARGDFGIA